MSYRSICVVFAVFFIYVHAQGKTKEELIKEVFGSGSDDTKTVTENPVTPRGPDLQPNSGQTETGGQGIPGTGSCTCVPYYLCNNGSVNTNGEGIIDIR